MVTDIGTTRPVPGLAHRHRPQVVAPFFAEAGDGSTLHRYLDDDFVARFLGDAHASRLSGTAAQPWFREDRFGGFKNEPSLRLPMHRAFYILCAEVQCAIPGAPAFDPEKIVSAGMVVRRTPATGAEQRWMIADGQPQGWRSGPIPDHDPDEVHRLTARGLLPPRFPEPPYRGEDITPLRPLLVRRRDHRGIVRSHTLLWGYLPLGGSAREAAEPNAAEVEAANRLDFGLEHRWPLGSYSAKAWAESDGRLIVDGVPSAAFLEFLQTLITRFQINDSADTDNSGLRNLLGSLRFHTIETSAASGHEKQVFSDTVLAWLDQNEAALIQFFARLAAGEETQETATLPATNRTHLSISEQQAADLRSLVALRTRSAQTRFDEGLALPRYGQGADDRFTALPFVRWVDDCGCEQIAWGPASKPFRVASPFDPEAQRPHTIVLPSLDDLKRGLPRGVAMLAPKSLADVLRKIQPSMDMKGGGPGNRSGSCWSFGFSLPAITLCAMLLLMAMIILLNVFFGWLPWVFLTLPRLCLKALKGK